MQFYSYLLLYFVTVSISLLIGAYLWRRRDAGGVRDLAEIRLLKSSEQQGIEGVIVGQAIYTGSLDLAQAASSASRSNA